MKNDNEKSFTDLFSGDVRDKDSSNKASFEDIFKNSSVLFPLDNKYEVNKENMEDNNVKDLFSVASQEEEKDEVEEDKSDEVKDLFSVASQEEEKDEIEEDKDNEVKDLFSVASQEEEKDEVEEDKSDEVKDLFSVASQEEEKGEVEEDKDNEVKDLFSVASQEEEKDEVEEDKDNEVKDLMDNANSVVSSDDAIDVGNNLFFDVNQEDDTVQNVDYLVQQNQPQESILNDNSLVQDVTPAQASSDNPFFADDALKENNDVDNNPLFLNTLNLVENVNQDKVTSGIDVTKSRNFNVKIVKKKEPLFKVIIGVISYAIFIWLLLVGIALLIYVLDIKIRQSKGDYSSPTYNAYVVLTGSMLPEIQVYDVVVTKKTDAADLKVGDVITFASADTRFLGTIITHRILKKNYDAEKKTYTFQTKGDNNNVADSALVPQTNIYGKVIVKIPKLGYLQEFLAADGGWIIVILIPCLAVISYDIVKLAKGLKRKKYKNIKVQK